MSAVPTTAAPDRGPLRDGSPGLRIVVPPRHDASYLFLLAALIAVGVFSIVSLSALAAGQSFAARALETEIADLTHRYEELTAEVAALEAPARVRRVAVEELGMVPVDQPGFLVVSPAPSAAPAADPATRDEHSGGFADPLKPALGQSR